MCIRDRLAGVRLGNEHGVNVYADGGRVNGIERVLGVHKGDFAAALLCLRQNVQGKRRLTGGFRTVDLDDTAAGQAADAEGGVQCKRTGRNGVYIHFRTVAQTHDCLLYTSRCV